MCFASRVRRLGELRERAQRGAKLLWSEDAVAVCVKVLKGALQRPAVLVEEGAQLLHHLTDERQPQRLLRRRPCCGAGESK